MNIDDIRRDLIIGAAWLENADNELSAIQETIDKLADKLEIENVSANLILTLLLIRDKITALRLCKIENTTKNSNG